MPEGIGCSMVGISVRAALDDVHSWCRVCVVRGVRRVLRDLAPWAMRRALQKHLRPRREERSLAIAPRRSTGLLRDHLQGRCLPLGL